MKLVAVSKKHKLVVVSKKTRGMKLVESDLGVEESRTCVLW